MKAYLWSLLALANGLVIFDEMPLGTGFFIANARSTKRLAAGGVQGSATCWAWNNSLAPTPSGIGYSNLEFISDTSYSLRSAPFTHIRFWLRTACPQGIHASVQVFEEWLNHDPPYGGMFPINGTWQQFAFPLASFAYPDPDPTYFVFKHVLFLIQEDSSVTCEMFVDKVEFVSLRGCDLVAVTESSSAVAVDCNNKTTPELKPGPVSPVVNITSQETGTAVTFILPRTGGETIDSSGTPVRTVSGGCHSDKVNCEWWDEINERWSSAGCTSNGTVSLGDGTTGVVCDCVHLTLFALVARREFNPELLCQTSNADFVFVAIYCVIAAYCVVQLFRSRALCKQGPKNALVSGCDTLGLVLVCSLAVCILRVLSLILKPFLSVGGLTILYALPSFLQLWTFTHLCITWFTVVRMQKNPYERMRLLFYGLNGLYFLSTIGISIAIASTTDAITDLARAGAYLLATFSLVLGLSLLSSGLTLVYELRKATRAVASSVQTNSADRKSVV